MAEATAAKAARVTATVNCMLSEKLRVLKRLWKFLGLLGLKIHVEPMPDFIPFAKDIDTVFLGRLVRNPARN